MSEPGSVPSNAQVERFAYLSPMLDSALSEMREFAKKKQDGIVSTTKIRLLNRLLTDVRGVLQGEDSVSYLENLSEEQLPQNSDAVLILGQYRAALDSFKERHFRYTASHTRTWITREWVDEQESLRDNEDDFDEDEDYDDEGEEEHATEEDKS
jgi:hypothetical protein